MMDDLYLKRSGNRRRLSSYDATGANEDWIWIHPGEEKEFARIEGAGILKHFWVTTDCAEELYLRKLVLLIYWDGETEPSVQVPLGDFFGLGHGLTRTFWSLPLQMAGKDGRGFNCWFPMPFQNEARFSIRSECASEKVMFYFYLDYEEHLKLPEETLYFHAQWHRENPTVGICQGKMSNDEYNFTGGRNQTGDDNYVILEAKGHGHYVGCHMDIQNLRKTEEFDWYGEGDDMIFIDGDVWPPTLHGTGMEDYFGAAFAPCEGDEFCSPWLGIILAGQENFSGKSSWYRYHVQDPVLFSKSIRVTIEHGHANRRSDDYSSTAYWYQNEPHQPFSLPSCQARLPRED